MSIEGTVQGATPPLADAGSPPTRHLVARRGPLWVGFDADQVLEVFPLVQLARVPRAPAWLVGAVQHQGRPLPVVDLARLAGIEAPAEAHLAVLLDHAEVLLAVVAEAVEVVSDAEPDTTPDAAPADGNLPLQSDDCARLMACWQGAPGDADSPLHRGLRARNGLRFHLLDADRVVEIVMGAVAPDGPV